MSTSELSPDRVARPTTREMDGSLLPSTTPDVSTRAERRAARTAELEARYEQDPDHCDDALMNRHPSKVQWRKARTKPVKDSRVYKTVQAYLALKSQGVKTAEIAERLGLVPTTLRQYVYRAHQKGWLTINSLSDPEDKLEIVITDKAIRNVNEFLDGRDKETTLEVLKGLGHLKQHQVVKGQTETRVGVALRVDVQMPVNPATGQVSVLDVRPGSVGGQPYYTEAEITQEHNDADE